MIPAAYTSSLTQMSVNHALHNTEIARMNAVENLAEYHSVHLINSTNSATVQSVTEVELSVYDVEVYEWTWIDYNDGHGGIPDRMGYATEHQMTLVENSDGAYQIIEDIYDESDILGVPSQGPELETTVIADPPSVSVNGTNSNVNINVNNSIDYGDKWVMHECAPNGNANYTSVPVGQQGCL